jgi:hypothetical protein
LEGVGDAFRLETEGAGTGFIGDAAVAVDYVEAVGPAGVVAFGGVLEIIEHGGKLDAEFDDAQLSHLRALVLIFGRGEDYVIVDIVRILPNVGGVRFTDVDRVERDLVLVFFIQGVEGGNLPPEWRSGVAAEDEDDWLFAAE